MCRILGEYLKTQNRTPYGPFQRDIFEAARTLESFGLLKATLGKISNDSA